MGAHGGGQQPVVLVGTGRCGSTMLHRLLALHEALGWISTFNEVAPAQPWLGAFGRLYRAPLPSRVKGWKAFPKPFEAYRFWERYLPGFSRRDRPPTPADVPDSGIAPVRAATARILRAQGRPRLLVKVTGWSRIAYFDRIYPDARFISLHRDPRSVVSSWMKAGWLDVTSPPDGDAWQWGAVPTPYLELWRDLGGGPLLSVALKIRLDLDDIAANMALLPGRCHEISYEDLIREPEATLGEVCDFAGLEWARFARVVSSSEFYDSTAKWREHLSEAEGRLVLEFLERTAGQSLSASRSSAAQR
jgi:Sulfotransferase family